MDKRNINEFSFEPLTTVKLCSVDLLLGSGHQIMFSSVEGQEAYFDGGLKHEFVNVSYVRIEDGVCRLPVNAEVLRKEVNYICIKNNNYSNKWYYGHIIRINYVAPDVCEIQFSLDTWQTYQFDVDLNKLSYVLRRHYSISEGANEIMFSPDDSIDVGNQYQMVEFNQMYPAHAYEDNCYLLVLSQGMTIKNTTNRLASQKHNYTTAWQYQRVAEYNESTDELISATQATVTGYTTQTSQFVISQNAYDYMVSNYFLSVAEMANVIQSVTILPITASRIRQSQAPQNFFNLINGTSVDEDAEKKWLWTSTSINVGDQQDVNNAGYLLQNYLANAIDDNTSSISYKYNKYKREYPNSALFWYLFKPQFTTMLVNDSNGTIKTYDLRLMNNKRLYEAFNATGKKGFNFKLRKYCVISPSIMSSWRIDNYNLTPINSFYNTWANENKFHQSAYVSDENVFFASNTMLPVVNDYTSIFLQSNFNTIQANRNSINRDYNTTVANASSLSSAQASANRLNYSANRYQAQAQSANASISVNNQLTNAGLSYNQGMTNSLVGGIAGGLGNLLTGNIGGSIGSLVGMGQGYYNNGVQLEMAQNSANATQAMANNTYSANLKSAYATYRGQQGINNANYVSAVRSASTSAQNQIDILNAQYKDAVNTADIVSNCGQGSLYPIVSFGDSMVYYMKSVQPEYLKGVINYYCMYGAKRNKLETIGDILSMFKYGCFIQTANANITGEIPQNYLLDIIQQFNEGIFIWVDSNSYMDYNRIKEE